MTSQSPIESEEPTAAYANAWASIQHMVFDQGASWSGREQNRVFLNTRGQTFSDVSGLSTIDYPGDGRAVATVDWDDDGHLDLVLKNRTAPRLQLLRNRDRSGGRFLVLRLEGRAGNRDAIGARATVELPDGRVLRRTVHAGDGYLAQSSKRLHFGVGSAARAAAVTVRWPGGSTESFGALDTNQRYALLEGSGAVTVIQSATVDLPSLPESARPVAPAGSIGRIPLVEKLPMQALDLPAFADPGRRAGALSGAPVLVNLWGVACVACLQEFGELAQQRPQLDRLGLRIVTMNTDGPDRRAAALTVLREFGLEQDAGYTGDSFLAALELVLAEVTGGHFGTPLPTSLLLDQQGQLVVVYRGRVDVRTLIRDVQILLRMNPADPSESYLSFGPRAVRRLRDFEGLAASFAAAGREDLAAYYRQVARSYR